MFDYYEISNIIGSVSVPGAVHILSNCTAAYFFKYLLEKAISVFKWELPKNWDKDYFLYVLYCAGYVGIVDSGPVYGVIPQWGTLSGYNVFYAPARFIYSNPLLKTGEKTIHEDCEIIRLQGNYQGIADMVGYYAGKMALLAEALDMNAINAKSSKIFFTKNRAAAETMKKLYDKVSSGNPCVVTDKDLLTDDGKLSWEWFNDNLSQNYIVTDIISDIRRLENEFCTDLGIPATNTEKKERMVADEVTRNDVETMLRADLWLERLKECCDRVNAMYGLNIKVDWRENPHERNNVNIGTSGNSSNSVRQSNNS